MRVAYAWFWSVIMVIATVNLDITSFFLGMQAFFISLAYYACAMGKRPGPHRRSNAPLRDRIPQLLPRLTPARLGN